jgi:hypothetical protein
MHPMVLLGDEAQVDSRFGLFEDSANLDARWVHSLCRMYDTLGNHFWPHSTDLLGDVGHVESHFNPFEDDVSVSARWVHGLHQTYRRLRNQFGCTRWYS